MIQFGPLRFQDSANFLKESLDALIKSQRKVSNDLTASFPRMASLHPYANGSAERLDLLLRKIPFPYKSMVDRAVFDQPAQLSITAYDNDLTGEACSEDSYELVSKVVDTLGLRTFGE